MNIVFSPGAARQPSAVSFHAVADGERSFKHDADLNMMPGRGTPKPVAVLQHMYFV
jgi:hypothetical protein